MKKYFSILLSVTLTVMISCSNAVYTTNGETIYRTGRNVKRQELLDKKNSQITFIKSCQGCHGKNGTRNRDCNVKWSYLSNSKEMTVPYTDSLFFRFLDEDLKSNGTTAITGVHWSMSLEDKKDLVEFLKSL